MRPFRRFRRLLPANLFARALLILVLPVILSQLVVAYVFYERHWKSVERTLVGGVMSDILWLTETYEAAYHEAGAEVAFQRTRLLGKQLGEGVARLSTWPARTALSEGRREYPELYSGLKARIDAPLGLGNEEARGLVHIYVALPDGMLDFTVSRKEVSSPTTEIFALWLIGSSLLFTTIAILFLRNQVKPIVALAKAAERLGLGQEVAGFHPRGASEVRRAGRAFLLMAERIRRQMQNRMEMLAGISHDLRTPLTRMTLELELATMDAVTRAALSSDIEEMRRMIDEYLDFARGDAGESPIETNLASLLTEIVANYHRAGQAVTLGELTPTPLQLRPQAIRRALTNLIDNALRYGGGAARVTLEPSATFIRIKVSDRGPGIPEAQMEHVFKPFTRLESSRNQATGGVGLGLSIARTVAQSHGGDVTLENLRDAQGAPTGLEVTLRLPRAVQLGSKH